jgi:putative ATP-dependent endonuclease of OLD family
MKMASVKIENYKGLRDIEIPLSRFVCVIGENNTGKSSILQAISLFFSGSTLAKTHYFDESKSIQIGISLTEVTDNDVDRLATEHREKIRGIMRDGALTLVRVYGAEGRSALKYKKLVPRDSRFSDENIDSLLKGAKPSQAFADAVVNVFPELYALATPAMGQREMRIAIQGLADSLPVSEKSAVDVDLPSGIDKSISALLPDPIYIPAVKDLRDDVKTTESTPFGKVLGILLKAIEPLLTEENALFEQLNLKLNRVAQSNGTESDLRLRPVRTIEETVERFVQESFRAVRIRIAIPPPELKAVLSSATIFANDGVDGPLETKGDGLRRAIVFAILRSYVELRKSGLIADDAQAVTVGSQHLLLFEEPELYLHPQAQQVLFDALAAFSQQHPVVVTTHSPAFFGPDATTTFVKLRKRKDDSVAPKPFAVAQPIDLQELGAKDQFQIICYENNNIAFFAETVVLVEGDSDYIVLPHLARVLNPAWDCGQLPLRFARIGGKGNIRRYRQFFQRFNMKVLVVTDLDFLLGNEFNQIEPSTMLRTQRDQLIQMVDATIQANNAAPEPNAEQLRSSQGRSDLRILWRRARELRVEFNSGQVEWASVEAAIDEFFAWEWYSGRKVALAECTAPDLRAAKRALLVRLRGEGVFVLEKGAIDDYYPPSIVGDGKPARAQSFCNTITTRDQAIMLSSNGHLGTNEELLSEFESIFQLIFG